METLEILTVPAWFDENEIPKRIDGLDIIAYLLRRKSFDDYDDASRNCMKPRKVKFEVTIKIKIDD